MAQPNHESIQKSNEDSISPNPMQVSHHVFNKVLKIDDAEIVSFSKWMEYRGMTTLLTYVLTLILN